MITTHEQNLCSEIITKFLEGLKNKKGDIFSFLKSWKNKRFLNPFEHLAVSALSTLTIYALIIERINNPSERNFFQTYPALAQALKEIKQKIGKTLKLSLILTENEKAKIEGMTEASTVFDLAITKDGGTKSSDNTIFSLAAMEKIYSILLKTCPDELKLWLNKIFMVEIKASRFCPELSKQIVDLTIKQLRTMRIETISCGLPCKRCFWVAVWYLCVQELLNEEATALSKPPSRSCKKNKIQKR